MLAVGIFLVWGWDAAAAFFSRAITTTRAPQKYYSTTREEEERGGGEGDGEEGVILFLIKALPAGTGEDSCIVCMHSSMSMYMYCTVILIRGL